MNEIHDLDSLVLACRNHRARSFIREAVACYRSGAHRASVISTWLAVVHDFIGKIEQLDLNGDPQAKIVAAEFRKNVEEHNITEFLKFERDLVALAKNNFELISPVEATDIDRILEDRNRCAHPSLILDDEPYDPGAECARYHIRNAVFHLLRHEPLQGKSALKTILTEIDGQYFPTAYLDILTYVRGSALARPRSSLLRSVFLVIIKKLLLESRDEYRSQSDGLEKLTLTHYNKLAARRISVLRAIRQIHPSNSLSILTNDFGTIAKKTHDDCLARLVVLSAEVEGAWTALGEATQNRVRQYVEKMPPEDIRFALVSTSKVPDLRISQKIRVDNLSATDWQYLENVPVPEEWIESAVGLYENSSSFDSANSLANSALIPRASSLSKTNATRILQCSQNGQVRSSFSFKEIVAEIALRKILSDHEIKSALADDEFWGQLKHALDKHPKSIDVQ